jgi:hypothetical protein
VAEMRQRAEAAEHRTAEAERRADAALALADQSVAMLANATTRADRAEAAIDGERKPMGCAGASMSWRSISGPPAPRPSRRRRPPRR